MSTFGLLDYIPQMPSTFPNLYDHKAIFIVEQSIIFFLINLINSSPHLVLWYAGKWKAQVPKCPYFRNSFQDNLLMTNLLSARLQKVDSNSQCLLICKYVIKLHLERVTSYEAFVKQKGSSDVNGSLWTHLDKNVLLWHHEAPLFLRVYSSFSKWCCSEELWNMTTDALGNLWR